MRPGYLHGAAVSSEAQPSNKRMKIRWGWGRVLVRQRLSPDPPNRPEFDVMTLDEEAWYVPLDMVDYAVEGLGVGLNEHSYRQYLQEHAASAALGIRFEMGQNLAPGMREVFDPRPGSAAYAVRRDLIEAIEVLSYNVVRLQVEQTTMRNALHEISNTLRNAATRNTTKPQELIKIIERLADASERAAVGVRRVAEGSGADEPAA